MEFVGFPKIPRLRRDVVITEKIDGTNACVVIEPIVIDGEDTGSLHLYAQSRTRIITPTSDNFGFAAWVKERETELVKLLGPGRHFGEWWGNGIQRGYGLDEKRFSLFNTARWHWDKAAWPQSPFAIDPNVGLYVVPMLGTGGFNDEQVNWALDKLRREGSQAAPFYDNPEGIVLFHKASGNLFKVLLHNDEAPKGEAAA